jgi:hypothetical protein
MLQKSLMVSGVYQSHDGTDYEDTLFAPTSDDGTIINGYGGNDTLVGDSSGPVVLAAARGHARVPLVERDKLDIGKIHQRKCALEAQVKKYFRATAAIHCLIYFLTNRLRDGTEAPYDPRRKPNV